MSELRMEGIQVSKARAEQVMRTYLTEVVANQRFELIPEFAAEDMVDHTQSIRGPAALHAHARDFCANLPDLQVEVLEIFATEDIAVGIWRWTGTPIEPHGISRQGKVIKPSLVASMFRFKDDMLVEYRPWVDAVEMLAQINDAA